MNFTVLAIIQHNIKVIYKNIEFILIGLIGY